MQEVDSGRECGGRGKGDSEGKVHQRFLKQRPAVELDLITAGARVRLQRRDSVSGLAARTTGISNAHAQGQDASTSSALEALEALGSWQNIILLYTLW